MFFCCGIAWDDWTTNSLLFDNDQRFVMCTSHESDFILFNGSGLWISPLSLGFCTWAEYPLCRETIPSLSSFWIFPWFSKSSFCYFDLICLILNLSLSLKVLFVLLWSQFLLVHRADEVESVFFWLLFSRWKVHRTVLLLVDLIHFTVLPGCAQQAYDIQRSIILGFWVMLMEYDETF